MEAEDRFGCHAPGRRAQQRHDVGQRAVCDEALRARRRFRQTSKKPQRDDEQGIAQAGEPEQLRKRAHGARVDGGRGSQRPCTPTTNTSAAAASVAVGPSASASADAGCSRREARLRHAGCSSFRIRILDVSTVPCRINDYP
jgi:hypothetical protein